MIASILGEFLETLQTTMQRLSLSTQRVSLSTQKIINTADFYDKNSKYT